jgi:ornithine decarboxylase
MYVQLDACMSELVRSEQVGRDDHSMYLFDLGSVSRRWAQWRTLLPRVQPFYAVKCCNDPGLLSTLAALGSSFDCASPFGAMAALGAPS